MAAPAAVLAALKAMGAAKTLNDNKERIVMIAIGIIALPVLLFLGMLFFLIAGGVQHNLEIPSKIMQDTVSYINTQLRDGVEVDNSYFPKMIAIGSMKTMGFLNGSYDIDEAFNAVRTDDIEGVIGQNYIVQYNSIREFYGVLLDDFMEIEEYTLTYDQEKLIESNIEPTNEQRPPGTYGRTVEGTNITEIIHIGEGKCIVRHSVIETVQETKKRMVPALRFPVDANYTFENTYGESKTKNSKMTHNGIDILAPRHTPVHSLTDGTVVDVGWDGLGGWMVLIEADDNLQFYYSHFDQECGFKKGDKVKKATVIGYTGNSGSTTEPVKKDTYEAGDYQVHIGFRMRVEKKFTWFNPYEFLKVLSDYKQGGSFYGR